MATSERITRVILENYKSIASCDVPLNRLAFLVGPNASGKSNFLDALRLVADALSTTLFQAINKRGGINEVVCRAPGLIRDKGRQSRFSIGLELALADGATATYSFSVASRPTGNYLIETEACEVRPATADEPPASFTRKENKVTSTLTPNPPAVAADRLYLVNASGLARFQPVYDALSRMQFYNVDPSAMRVPQQNEAGQILSEKGGNIASVLRRLEESHPRVNDHIQAYLRQIVPDLHSVRVSPVGQFLTLSFRIDTDVRGYDEDFTASSMSDGTLHALGTLVALFQPGIGDAPLSLITIEEPETALHPGATAVLLDALRDASEDVQVIVTTHSPDILDHKEIDGDAILAFVAKHGVTILGPLNAADKSLLRDRLYTAGGLMREAILQPDPTGVSDASRVARVR